MNVNWYFMLNRPLTKSGPITVSGPTKRGFQKIGNYMAQMVKIWMILNMLEKPSKNIFNHCQGSLVFLET